MGRPKVVKDEALLEAARSVFLELGAFGTTKEVARRAGVSEAVIFQRFPTKAALFVGAMVPTAPDVASLVIVGRDNPKRDLVATGKRMLSYFRKVIPAVMHLITYPNIKMADVFEHFGSMPPQDLNSALTAQLSALHREGKVHAPKPMATASLFVSAIHSLAVFELMEMHGSQPMDHAVEQFVEAIWAGLRPPGER